jgi:hypothetical protein
MQERVLSKTDEIWNGIIPINEFACLQGQIHNGTKNMLFVLCIIPINEFACLQGQIHNKTKNMEALLLRYEKERKPTFITNIMM